MAWGLGHEPAGRRQRADPAAPEDSAAPAARTGAGRLPVRWIVPVSAVNGQSSYEQSPAQDSPWPARDMFGAAHGLIANASDWKGDPPSDSPDSVEWRAAAQRWIDTYGEQLSRERVDRATQSPPRGYLVVTMVDDVEPAEVARLRELFQQRMPDVDLVIVTRASGATWVSPPP